MTSPATKLADYYAQVRADRVEFVEERLDYGFTTADIIDDLGIDRNSISRSMYRAGRPDLARRFALWQDRNPERNYTKGYTCDACGERRSNKSTKWCLSCRNRVGTRAAA